MERIDENTVKADMQLGNNSNIVFDFEKNCGTRILFVGNSITRHAPKSEIGWFYDWGMAASSKETDYVHVVERMVLEKEPSASFCVCHASGWECNYIEGETTFSRYLQAREFKADIIIMRLIENCNSKEFKPSAFKKEYEKFIDFLNADEHAKIIITSSFWKHPGDIVLKEIADTRSLDYVYLGDLGENSLMRADGLFDHRGVSVHPGDEGMRNIALRIFEKLEDLL